MSGQPTVPLFDESTVHHALECLRQARPPGDTPLRRLVWVQERIDRHSPTVSPIELDVALGEALTSLIEENLGRLRAVQGLPTDPAGDREAALDRLRDDFAQANTELEAWSLLYYRYVRLDLDLQVQQIARTLNLTPRQARRRLGYGYRRLAEAISRLERAARAANRRLWLALKLPPPSYTRLFGSHEARTALVERLLEASPPHAIVLTGPGGIGKTALAHAAARRLIDEERFADFAWLTLEEPTAYPTLLAALARELGYPHLAEADPATLEAALGVRLGSAPTLIVLDGADHLADRDALIARLSALVAPGRLDAQSAPGRLLLTTRQRPAPGTPIHLLPVGPLSRDAFAALLRDEARRRRLSRSRLLDEKTIDAIYRAVGGNPLAGRLIVGQLATLPRERVLDNLPALETAGGERLFDALFMPTWETLGETAQLAALALTLLPFEGAYWHDLHDLLDLPGEDLDQALRELVAGSFVDVRDDTPRYVMPTLARSFVREQAQRPPWADPYRRLLHKAIPHREEDTEAPADAPGVIARMVSLLHRQAEAGEPPEALTDLVVELAPVARRSGQWLIWRDVLIYVVTHLRQSEARPRDLACALRELGIVHRWLGDADAAEEALREAVVISGEQGDFVGQAEALLEAGQLYEALGQTGPAYEAYQRAAAAGHRYDELALRRRALNGLAGLALSNSLVEEALALLDEALETFGGEPPDGQTLAALGAAYLQAGDADQAIVCQQQALDRFREAGDLPGQARAHMRLGMAHNQAGRPDDAFYHLQEGFSLMRALGDVLGLARLLTNLGVVHAEDAHQDVALRVWREALALQEQLGDRVGMAYTRYNLADLRWKLGQHAAARDDLDAARALAERLNLLSLLATIEGHPLTNT